LQPQTVEPAWPLEETETPQAEVRWSLARRIGFRFLFSYLVLFFLTGQEIANVPGTGLLVEKYTAFWHVIAVWVGRHLFHIQYEIVMNGMGSGDTTFRWILLPCYLALAAVAAAVWSVLDRRRTEYRRLWAWLRLLLRFTVGVAMIIYGVSKVIPMQMPAPSLFTLQQRVGDLTPMRLLWTFIGSSPAYETFTGLAELAGGVLLLVPRTTLLGALICAADMTMVFMLNLCYDVPVKIMSFHYLLMSLLLVAPEVPRLFDLFIRNRPVAPSRGEPALFTSRLLDRGVQAAFFLFGLVMIGLGLYEIVPFYRERNPPHPPLYGIWSVEEFQADGRVVPPFTEPESWRRVSFQSVASMGTTMGVEQMIGKRQSYTFTLDQAQTRLTLHKTQRDEKGMPVLDANKNPKTVPGWQAELAVAKPEPDVLVLEGLLDGRRTRAKLRKVPLLGRSFHWIIDPPKE
jgi:uncharacterized membrane protein YphA (DoxX/SURF4 family)